MRNISFIAAFIAYCHIIANVIILQVWVDKLYFYVVLVTSLSVNQIR